MYTWDRGVVAWLSGSLAGGVARIIRGIDEGESANLQPGDSDTTPSDDPVSGGSVAAAVGQASRSALLRH